MMSYMCDYHVIQKAKWVYLLKNAHRVSMWLSSDIASYPGVLRNGRKVLDYEAYPMKETLFSRAFLTCRKELI